MLHLLLALSWIASPFQGPVEFGKRALERAGAKLADIEVRVDGAGPAESFSITTDGARARVLAHDPIGAMYGEFELAQQIERHGAKAFETSVTKCEPFLSVRAINPFLTLPWDSEKNEPIYDPAALTDPERWWFHNEDYWTTLFDLIA
ncbi:MAG: hypothetical protein ABI054_13430 [Planctomycetota bacterium]